MKKNTKTFSEEMLVDNYDYILKKAQDEIPATRRLKLKRNGLVGRLFRYCAGCRFRIGMGKYYLICCNAEGDFLACLCADFVRCQENKEKNMKKAYEYIDRVGQKTHKKHVKELEKFARFVEFRKETEEEKWKNFPKSQH